MKSKPLTLGHAAVMFIPLLAGCVESIRGQGTPPPPVYQPAAPAFTTGALASPLAQLVAPIALYPDPLVALILPASTNPDEIGQAAQALASGADVGQLSAQPWDPSVLALLHYPTVLRWMALNPVWTQALGQAFAADPAAAMAQIQRLRSVALAAGTLTSSAQQVVVVSDGVISIEPATETVLYVPTYNPWQVFVDQRYDGFIGPLIAYGDPWPLGLWLGFGFDWGHGRVLYGDSSAWRRRPDAEHASSVRPPVAPAAALRQWQPHSRPVTVTSKPGQVPVLPAYPGAASSQAPLPRPRLDPVSGRGSTLAQPSAAQTPGAPASGSKPTPYRPAETRNEVRDHLPATPAPASPSDRRYTEPTQGARTPPPQPRTGPAPAASATQIPQRSAPAPAAPTSDKADQKSASDRDRNTLTH